MNAAERLVSEARRGRFLEVLPELLDLAARPQGDPEEPWQAAVGALEILFWQDRFEEAALLHEALLRTAEAAEGGGLDEAMRRAYRWGEPPSPVDDSVIGGHLLRQDFRSLPARDRRLYWAALRTVNDFAGADALYRSLDEVPEDDVLCGWMAACYGFAGDTAAGEDLLIRAHSRWWPNLVWDVLPSDPVTHPHLRPVCTERVRDHYLTRPIGPEAEKATQR